MGFERIRGLAERAGLRGVQPRVVLALAFICIAVAAMGLWRGFGGRSESFEIEPRDSSNVGLAGGESTDTSAGVVVHVAGAVARPGVVELPVGSRVLDAIEACGGLLGNAAPGAVNLARTLTDSEQIVVPTQDEVAQGAAAGAGGASTPGGRLNLNSATAQQLQDLPGIGPSTAAKIVSDREQNGPFRRPEDLQRVPGIGPKKYESLKDLVVVR